MRKLPRALFISVSAMVLVLAGTTPAWADGFVYTNPSYLGHAEFYDYGEHLYACDDYADGMRVTVAYHQWGELEQYLDDANGANNSCAHVNLELAEGSGLYIQVCRSEGANGELEDCGTELFVTA